MAEAIFKKINLKKFSNFNRKKNGEIIELLYLALELIWTGKALIF